MSLRLATARITNFRCIEDSEPFSLPAVTCLVGKNESGKTAILQALYRLNPDRTEESYDLIRDYPRRRLADYQEAHGGIPAQILETGWELGDDDIEALGTLIGPEAPKNRTIRIHTHYPTEKGKRGGNTWYVTADENAVTQHLINSAPLHDEEKEALRTTVRSIKDLKAAVDSPPTERHEELKALLAKSFKRGTAVLATIDLLHSRLPVFVYFSQYDVIRGRMHLETLRSKVAQQSPPLAPHERLFLDLCEFAGSNLEELASIASFETLKARFEAAQTKITQQIFEYWSTNTYLAVEFSRDQGLPEDDAPFNAGNVFNIRIKNELHGNTVPFDDRSTGFVWFFSFLVLFSQVRKRFGKNIILLLDEPGLNLHAQAQGDLLRYISEKLEPEHQVIYTTHSLFMVPPEDLLSVRIVEDVIKERPRKKPEVFGTKVRSDVLEVSNETLFPLQGALGFEISQTLFVGKNTLMVEGPSDLLYFTAYSAALSDLGRPRLDPRWTICPVGGIDKVPAFLALFGAKLNIAVVVDLATGAKKKITDARKLSEDLLKRGRVFTFADFTGKAESDVEDMLGSDGYVALVNEAHGLNPPLVLDRTNLPVRVLPWVEAELRVHKGNVDFDHYRPSEYLLANRARALLDLPSSAEALNRFEALFTQLNGLL